MSSVQYIGWEKVEHATRNLGMMITTAIRTTGENKGRQLYNSINNITRVRTGRLKRGNMMEISDTGFHYWNNVPYAGFMNTGARGNRYVDDPFYSQKDTIVVFLNSQIAQGLKNLFSAS